MKVSLREKYLKGMTAKRQPAEPEMPTKEFAVAMSSYFVAFSFKSSKMVVE